MMTITYSEVYTVESTWWSLHGGVYTVESARWSRVYILDSAPSMFSLSIFFPLNSFLSKFPLLPSQCPPFSM